MCPLPVPPLPFDLPGEGGGAPKPYQNSPSSSWLKPKTIYVGQIDVQSQINLPKELPTTGNFCVLLIQSARKYLHCRLPPPPHYTVCVCLKL